MKFNRAAARRGVLLLVILGLLAMFGLVAVAFVVLTGQAWRSALAVQRIDQYYDPPEDLTYQGAMQVFRGPSNPASRMGSHSLLEDIYGHRSIEGSMENLDSSLGNGQLLEFTTNVAAPTRRVGCVLTMLDGPAAGRSTRIVGCRLLPDGVTHAFQILPFDDVTAANLLAYIIPDPSNLNTLRPCRYIINGTPFSGTGIGYAASPSGELDDASPINASWPLALLPGAMQDVDPQPRKVLNPPGGANEDYDAPDFQNMLLGAQVRDPETGVVTTIPSLHRPALVNYWRNQPNQWDNPDPAVRNALRRSVILRPLVEDHPHFGLVNPAFDPVNGPWDVDNDGDGQLDSIWVDLGMPVRSTPDGRLYKPLFAVLCVDLDGRLNLNAHGCWAQTDPNYLVAAGQAVLPRGQGCGPAEINLLPLFDGTAAPAQAYAALLGGIPAGLLEGRYGEFGDPLLTSNGLSPQPGASVDDGATWRWADDLLSRDRHFSYPQDYGFDVLSSYATPPDMHGNLLVFLDTRGQPDYRVLGNGWSGGRTNSPYELDLSRNRARRRYWYQAGAGGAVEAGLDSPFTVTELERLLRPFDRDAPGLPDRLAKLTSATGLPRDSVLVSQRHAITTESRDLPCPSVVAPPDLRGRLDGVRPARGPHVIDLLGNLSLGRIRTLLPPELLAGMRMDLNRPLGNGLDDDGNGVVDDPGERLMLFRKWKKVETFQWFGPAGQPILVPFDHDNDGVPIVDFNPTAGTARAAPEHDPEAGDPAFDPSGHYRQLYARHLYVLMMLLMDRGYEHTSWTAVEDKAYHVAQWAVNVVDFRDRDSIMTRFVYDPEPLDGWDPDGTRVVWGCERPELLIMETLAFHDRRTEDRDDAQLDPPTNDPDDQDTKTVIESPDPENPQTPDADFDQRLKPQGTLLIELYNPWANHDPDPSVRREPPPGEFYYDPQGGNWLGGVNLAQTVTDPDTGQKWPVWRMIIVFESRDNAPEGDDNREKDPDHPDPNERPDQESIERAVYFVQANYPSDATTNYYPGGNYARNFILVPPGRYAAVGPGEPDGQGRSATHVGLRKQPLPADQTKPIERDIDRQIVLDPTARPGAEPMVEVINNGPQGGVPDPSQIPPAVPVIINTPHRLSVSEPAATGADYYPGTDAGDPAQPYDPVNGYPKPYDIPLDKQKQPELWDMYLKHTGTHENYCVIHLQRLANPLEPYRAEFLDEEKEKPNPAANPYRTIDSMPVDLTTFNGVDTSGNDEPGSTVNSPKFSTRERGEAQNAEIVAANLWRHEPTSPKSQWASPRPTENRDNENKHVFADHLRHTLGYLNAQFGLPRTDAGADQGFPEQGVFPWLTWNNRPFVSQLELMLVPGARSSKLLGVFGLSTGVENDYDPATEGSFPHLASLFPSTGGDGTSPQFHRLLELVHVPSRFVGTADQANPTLPLMADGAHAFHPPFHHVARYREPGRINLNTVFSPDVFQGLINYLPGMSDLGFWEKFVRSRGGYTTQAVADPQAIQAAMLAIDPAGTYPTRFVHPFRSFGGGALVSPVAPPASLKPLREIDATLLRPDPDSANQPLFQSASPNPYNNTNRNPYFRYQGLQRLGNLVTTRSNVYSVWITVGYFQVEAWPGGIDAAHPDGYQLGAELGSDTGEIQRHRAFYIFDRSIPVGFRRGQDLNVEQAVLLKRFIE